MIDPTEDARRALVAVINGQVAERAAPRAIWPGAGFLGSAWSEPNQRKEKP